MSLALGDWSDNCKYYWYISRCEGQHRGCRPHRLFVMCSSSTAHKSLKCIFQCDTESCSVITIYSVILYHPYFIWTCIAPNGNKTNIFANKGRSFTCCYSYGGGIWRISTWAVVQHHSVLLSFYKRTSSKKGSHFFCPKHCNPFFCYLRHKSNPLSVPKIHRQLYAKS
jgi:hypothetical protein